MKMINLQYLKFNNYAVLFFKIFKTIDNLLLTLTFFVNTFNCCNQFKKMQILLKTRNQFFLSK